VFCACEGGVEDCWVCQWCGAVEGGREREWRTVCAACEEEEHGCGVYALVLLSVLLRFGCGRDEAVVTGDSKGVAVDGEVW
jgi:hypothetical protein